jgi:hypothetical protein
MTIKNFFNGEVDFTKQLSENKYWFKELLKVCNIDTNNDIDSYTEGWTGDTSVGSGRFDIFEENSMSVVEAQLDGLDWDHMNRGLDYALSIETQYGHQVNNIIYLTDGDVPSLSKRKLEEFNQGQRNFFIVKVFPYLNQGKVDLNFTLIDGPEIIKQRNFKPNGNFIPSQSNMIQSSASEPWRTNYYLDKINHIQFFGSVGLGKESLQYWVMRVGEMWVSSDGHVHHTANGCMRLIRLSSFIKVYGEERKPNLNFWGHHKDINGSSIDNLLKEYFEQSN